MTIRVEWIPIDSDTSSMIFNCLGLGCGRLMLFETISQPKESVTVWGIRGASAGLIRSRSWTDVEGVEYRDHWIAKVIEEEELTTEEEVGQQ